MPQIFEGRERWFGPPALKLRRRSASTALPLRSRYGLFIRDSGPLHRLNFFFKPPGGGGRAKFAVRINEDLSSSGSRLAKDAADIATVAHVRAIGADANNVIGRADLAAGGMA